MTGEVPLLAAAAYAALLWGVALALDAVAGRACGGDRPGAPPGSAPGSDVARFHRGIGGALLAVAASLLVAFVLARRDAPALGLLPVAGICLAGAFRRVRPLFRDP